MTGQSSIVVGACTLWVEEGDTIGLEWHGPYDTVSRAMNEALEQEPGWCGIAGFAGICNLYVPVKMVATRTQTYSFGQVTKLKHTRPVSSLVLQLKESPFKVKAELTTIRYG